MADEEGQEAGDPAQAFEALRGEVAVLRRAIQGLPAAWQDTRPPDYSPDLGRLVKGLTAVEGRLAAMEVLPMLSVPPGQFAAAANIAGLNLVREAADTLDQATRGVRRHSDDLVAMIGSARSQDEQNSRVIWTGFITALMALLVGLFLSPYFASVLPFGWNQGVATIVMGANRWQAGTALMQAAHPQEWNNIALDWKVIDGNAANARAVSGCWKASVKTGKPQACRIMVQVMQP